MLNSLWNVDNNELKNDFEKIKGHVEAAERYFIKYKK